MSLVFLVLRVVHILSATFWFGGLIVLTAFILPTAQRTGPDGGRFMQSLAGESGLTHAFTAAGWLATLAGLGMFYFVSGHFDRDWMRSHHGMTLSAGMTFGLLAFLHGAAVQGANSRKLARLSQAVAAAGGPPSPDQLAQLSALRDKLASGGRVLVVLLALAAAAMAVARYV